jgi:hypothetical protein
MNESLHGGETINKRIQKIDHTIRKQNKKTRKQT